MKIRKVKVDSTGKRVPLTLKENYDHLHKRYTRLANEHRLLLGQKDVWEMRTRWKQDEVDKLKHELALYQVAYLQEEDELKKRVFEIARVLHKKDNHTKKQLIEAMEQILLQE